MGIFNFFIGESEKTLDLLKSKKWVKETKDSYCSLEFYEGGYGLHSISENITLSSPEPDNFTYTLNKKKLIISYNDGTYVEIIIKEINETKLVTYIEKYNNERLYDILKHNSSTFFYSGVLESLPSYKKKLIDKRKDLLEKTLELCIGAFVISLWIAGAVGFVYIVDFIVSPNTEICVDNYSDSTVFVYLDDELWKEVPSSSNFDINSLDNDFYDIDAGSYSLDIKDDFDNLLQHSEIQVKEGEKYILNILNKVTYQSEDIGYGEEKSRKYESKNELFFRTFCDYCFTGKPPKSVRVRKGKKGDYKSSIERISF